MNPNTIPSSLSTGLRAPQVLLLAFATLATAVRLASDTGADLASDQTDPLPHAKPLVIRSGAKRQMALAQAGGEGRTFASDSQIFDLAQAAQAAQAVATGFSSDLSIALSDLRSDGEVLFGPSSHNPASPLIIQATAPEDPAFAANLREDLSVMSQILAKAMEKIPVNQANTWAMGIKVTGMSFNRGPQSFYIDGYGVLFLFNTRVPLAASTEKPRTEPEKQSDATWEQTKRELYGARPRKEFFKVNMDRSTTREYDPQQVETLQKELVDSLRYASNIRHLKPTDSVTVTVSGGPAAAKRRKTVVKEDKTKEKAEDSTQNTTTETTRPSRSQTTLTVTAKKSDIDAFFKGLMIFEDFRKKTSVTVSQ